MTTILPAPNAPLAVAQALVDERYKHHRGAVLLRHWRGSFWSWKGSHWIEMEDAAVRAEVYRFTEHATYLDDKGNQKPWSPNRYKVADVIDSLRAVGFLEEEVHAPAWLGNPFGFPAGEIVACRNGLLHVPTRDLIEHDPRYFNTVAVPFPYMENPPLPTRWLTFLDQLWPDDAEAIQALQEFFGYVISGRTDLQKILLLIGPTRAGKGVIARVLKTLVGAGNAAGPTLASLGTNFGLAPLIGKPLAIISDARLGGANVHQIVERLLSISGEDMLTIDRKYREPWTGTLSSRFVVISNELPRFGDASGAIARRFIVLTLGQSWLGKENPALTRELLAELPGIFGWALDGLDALTRAKAFTEPKTSQSAVVALQDIASPTSAFVREWCEVGPENEVPVTTLFAEWKAWCDENGRDRPGTVQMFGRDLRAVVPGLGNYRPRDGANRERHYLGVRVKTLAERQKDDPTEQASATGTHNGTDRGPLRTAPPVHDGPQSKPLSLPVNNDYLGGCRHCGKRTGRTDITGSWCCSRCQPREATA